MRNSLEVGKADTRLIRLGFTRLAGFDRHDSRTVPEHTFSTRSRIDRNLFVDSDSFPSMMLSALCSMIHNTLDGKEE